MTTLPLIVRPVPEAPTVAPVPVGSVPRAVGEDEMPPLWVFLLLPVALVAVAVWVLGRKVVRGIVG